MQKGEHEMNTPEEENCAPVPAQRQAQQAQEARPYWGWVEPAVWTAERSETDSEERAARRVSVANQFVCSKPLKKGLKGTNGFV
jgi:hypothetical protein